MGNGLEGKESGGRDAGEEALAIAQYRGEEGPRLEDVGMDRVFGRMWEPMRGGVWRAHGVEDSSPPTGLASE